MKTNTRKRTKKDMFQFQNPTPNQTQRTKTLDLIMIDPTIEALKPPPLYPSISSNSILPTFSLCFILLYIISI